MQVYPRLGSALAACALVGGGVAYAAVSPRPTSHPIPHHSFAASLGQHFAVFTHPSGTPQSGAGARRLPAVLVRSFNDPAQGNSGADAAAAVYLTPNAKSSFGFWAVPGKSGACLVWQTTAVWPSSHAECGPLRFVNRMGLSHISSVDGPQVIFGVVPNGAVSVTVTNTDGSTASAPVTDNAYVVVNPIGKPKSASAYGSTGAAQPLMGSLPAN